MLSPTCNNDSDDLLIQMNEDAIHSLYEGDAEEAVSTLLACLERAHGQLPSSFRFTASDEMTVHLEAIPLAGALVADHHDGATGRYYDTECFGLYRFAFTADRSRARSLDDGQGRFCFQAAVSFNLALIYHHQGLTCADLPMLSRALSLYRLGLDLVGLARDSRVVACSGGSTATTTTTGTLRLALYNNLGHVSSFLGDDQGVLQCRRGLQAELRQTQPDCAAGSFFRESLALAREYPVVPWASVA